MRRRWYRNRYQLETSAGVVTVWADTEAQAKNRGKWKAVHKAFTFRNRAEELTAVRECEVFALKRIH